MCTLAMTSRCSSTSGAGLLFSPLKFAAFHNHPSTNSGQTVNAVFSISLPDFDRVKSITKVSKNDGRSNCFSRKIS